jgi:hypothetical protein
MTDGPFRPRGPERPAPPPEGPEAPPPGRGRRPGPPRPPSGLASHATWLLGVAVVILLAYVTVNTIRTEKPGSRGVRAGTRLPPFAAPLVTGTLQGDANVFVKATKGVPRACDVRGPDVLNSCQLAERGPSVLAFLATRSQECVDEIDRVDALRARFPDVQFAAVAIRGDRGDLRRLVRRHGWRLPVAYDRDGAVSNAYAIAVCPTITFARAGGEVSHTTLGGAPEAELARRVQAIRR